MGVDRIIWNKLNIIKKDFPFEFRPMTGDGKSTRDTLAEILCDAGYSLGAEIGVEMGRYSEVLCRANPNLKLILVDPWERYNGRSQRKMDWFYEMAMQRLKSYNVEFRRKRSLDAVKEVPDRSLDFVYIDGLHDFDNVMMDIISWVPKVKIGGIVSGHDYAKLYGFKLGSFNVVEAVDLYVQMHRVPNWYLTSDDPPSWFWVKRT